MKSIYTQAIVLRLEQLKSEIANANIQDFHDRICAFVMLCNQTPALSSILSNLPQAFFDFNTYNLYNIHHWGIVKWPSGNEEYSTRWDALRQIAEDEPDQALMVGSIRQAVAEIFFEPVYNYLVHHLATSSTILYALLRYKRWAEWFEAGHLRDLYHQSGEDGLDSNVRRFLFESGIDYPYSQPASPQGKVDIVAGLETDDPLVLEIKIWDSTKQYKQNRVRDGLRQVMDYAEKYGKDTGHVMVFNLDQEPLSFVSDASKGHWPPRIEHGSRTYFFVQVHIAQKSKPPSQQDKGKPVQVQMVDLNELLAEVE